jgi:hypothetical protein
MVVGREYKPTGVRLPPDLKKALDAEAAKNGRSRNSEIVYRLAQSLRPGSPKPDSE